MAKKRRLDRKRDKSSGQRIANFGKAALTVGVGVALLGRARIDEKVLGDIGSSVLKTRKNIRKDLLNRKRTASNLYDAYQKNIGKGGKAFKETLEAQRKKKIHIRTDSTKNMVGKYHAVNQYTSGKLYDDLRRKLKNEIKGETIETLLNEFGDKYSLDQIKQIVDDTVPNLGIVRSKVNNDPDKINIDFIRKTIDAMGMSEDDALKIVKVTDMNYKKLEGLEKSLYQRGNSFEKELNKKAKEELNKYTRGNKNINKLGKFLGIGNLDEVLTGSHALTLKELVDHPELLDESNVSEYLRPIRHQGRGKEIKSNPFDELIQALKDNKDGSLDDLIIDERLRVKTKADGGIEVFDASETIDFIEEQMDKFNSSIVGKVLTKGIDRKSLKDVPEINFHQSWVRSMNSQFDDVDDKISRRTRVSIGNKLFDINETDDGIYELGEQIAEGHVVDMNRGFIPGVIKRWLGSGRTEPLASRNRLFEMLDINQDGNSNFIKRFSQFFTKFDDPDWGRNVLDRIEDELFSGRNIAEEVEHLSQEMDTDKSEILRRLHEDHNLVNRLFRSKAASEQISDDTTMAMLERINQLIDYSKQNNIEISDHLIKSQNILEMIINGDTEEFFKYLTEDTTLLQTQSLIDLRNNYIKDSAGTLKRLTIETRQTKKMPVLDIEMPETNVGNIHAIIRREGLKEILSDQDLTEFIVQSAGPDIGGQQLNALMNLYHWQGFENATMAGREFDSKIASLFYEGSKLDDYIKNLDNDELNALGTFKSLEDMKSEFGILHKGNMGNPNERYGSEYDRYEFVAKSNWGMDLIKNINDKEKWKAAIKELNGGGDNLENASMVSVLSQYMINRLSMGVEDSGLGLSGQSLSSPLASMKNIFMKRVLPVMVAYTAFDYLNDLSQDLTGVGITGAAANSIANIDIAGRKLLYNIGIGDLNVGQMIDNFKQTSVIGEYWTGSNDFQTAEERREWYADGYSPVRKSRFWSFGSSSEFRGGDITFFQPNYLRRIHSDYRDEWLYGGNKEKWAHSIIPTPTHPFSTIRYLMDPYWLERKHMDDAPTPLTGKMFSEGTPWGAVLNPTVGEVIKPQIMLPEVKRRLTGKGHDAKALLKVINERTKEKSRNRKDKASNDDLLVINGTDIRNATYIPYGQPNENELIITGGRVRGLDYMDKLSNVGEYAIPVYNPDTTGQQGSGMYIGGHGNKRSITIAPTANKLTRVIGETSNEMVREVFNENGGIGEQLIKAINQAILNKGESKGGYSASGPTVFSSSPDSTSEGTYVYNNLINEYNTRIANYYEDQYTPDLVDKSILKDHLRDVKHSVKNLSGIYGFIGDTAFGSDEFTFRYENAGSYTSFTKGFWDAGLGGMGGGIMEIARRFFPSQDRSRVDYNPLRNNVADWLPDYLQVGNPFSKLTKGEMRLPGKGYESLNELHPDEYATDGYGSFDRFKILADVAPNSQEYKVWHNIVKHQVTDPELKEEIKEIEARTKRMRGSHEFYEYQYLHTNTKYEKGIVKEIQGDKVVLVNNQILTLAGVKATENYNGELNDFLTPGQEITYRTTDDAINDHENGVIRNAAIYTEKGGDSINKQLMDLGVVERDHTDTSSIGQLATVTSSGEFWGAAQELLAHARIPIFHNKLMHIETALESFESEQIYGANFQTWDHPIEGYIKPMINETIGQSMFKRVAVELYKNYHFNHVLVNSTSRLGRFASGTLMVTLDPAAMLGGTIGFMRGLNNGRVGRGNQPMGAFSQGAKIGSTIGTFAWAYGNADNPFKAAASFALAGIDAYNKLELGEFAARFGRQLDWKGSAIIGAGIGLAVSALKNPGFDKDKMFGKKLPKKYLEKVKLDEYFDRLEYIKYKGLYEVAAKRARRFEKTNIKQIFKEIDKNKERIEKLKKEKKDLLKKYDEGDSGYIARAAKLNEEIEALTQRGNQMFVGGKYTKAAVAYKKAMESTIYGLSPGATKDEILASIPDQYKDYFQSFMEVTDESEREEILKHLPDYLKRPLQAAWGQEMEDVQSNRKYFKSHKLPSMNWRGWKPNINLKHVKMKTIENEGMLLADFGFYESEKAKAAYEMAPDIDDYDQRSKFNFSTTARLTAEMRGMGIRLSNVSIEKTSTPGFWITADMKQSISDRAEYRTNSISNAMQSLVANFI